MASCCPATSQGVWEALRKDSVSVFSRIHVVPLACVSSRQLHCVVDTMYVEWSIMGSCDCRVTRTESRYGCCLLDVYWRTLS